MNPPYARGLNDLWSARIARCARTEVIGSLVVLVDAATDTSWWHGLAAAMDRVCFLHGRVRFWSPEVPPAKARASGTRGQCLLHAGKRGEVFEEVFGEHGLVLPLTSDSQRRGMR